MPLEGERQLPLIPDGQEVNRSANERVVSLPRNSICLPRVT